MPTYDLERLGDTEFEHLAQALLKEVIGNGTITFGSGADGGREATFQGTAPYPSQTSQWSGEWLFQAKFHDVRTLGANKGRSLILAELDAELDKVIHKYNYHVDNYVLITNVPLSSTHDSGTHDRIEKRIKPKFAGHVTNIHVWGADDIQRYLETYPGICRSFLHLMTPGDLIAELLDYARAQKTQLAESIKLFLAASYKDEQFAQLDQAGEVNEERLPLEKVFIDLEVTATAELPAAPFAHAASIFNRASRPDQSHSATSLLLSEAQVQRATSLWPCLFRWMCPPWQSGQDGGPPNTLDGERARRWSPETRAPGGHNSSFSAHRARSSR